MIKAKVVSFVSALLVLIGGMTPAFSAVDTPSCTGNFVAAATADKTDGQATQTQSTEELNASMAGAQPAITVIEPPLPGQKRYRLHMLCATNRKQQDIKPKFNALGEVLPAKRMKFLNEASSDGMTYCECEVSFSGKPDMQLLQTPMDCKLSPYSWVKWRLKSPRIESIKRLSESEFFAYLRKASPDGQIYLNIPGSFTAFDEAVKRGSAAVLALDSKAAFTLSWPSLGTINPNSYGYDGTQAERSILTTHRLLNRLAKEFGAENVHVIAHSMGNRLVSWAAAVTMLKNGCLDDEGVCIRPEKFGRLEMVSADVDASLFVDNYAQSVKATYTAVDIWVSKKDKALFLSKLVHKKPRLGQKQKELPVIPGHRFIVFTKADMGKFGHSVPFPIVARIIKSKGKCPGYPWKLVRIRDGESPVDVLIKRDKNE